jgi:hypothetical protein
MQRKQERLVVTSRRASASRNRNSICALTLRSSACARRSSSFQMAGSTRSRNALRSGIVGALRWAGVNPDSARRRPGWRRRRERRA